MSSNSTFDVEVAIIGGGMGGLVAGVALNQAGIDAHVFEQAPAYGDVGGHLTMDTAAIEVLANYGLDKPFLELSSPLACMELKKLSTGDVVMQMPFPDLGALGVEDESRKGDRQLYAFLRSDFLKVAVEAIPESKMHTGHILTSLENGDGNATATFENGNTVTAKVILGADGVKSLARRMFDDSAAAPAGHSILRTLCSVDVLPERIVNDRMNFWDGWEFGDKEAGIGAHMLTVPVRGGKFVSVDIQFQGGDQLEDCDPWDIPVERVLARYPAKDEMDPVIYDMIEARLEPITVHALWDRPVASKWVDGQIAILGDAAHNMRPTLGQGACQAIHDAHELTKCLSEKGLTSEALKAYESVRAPYVKSIVEVAKNLKVDPKAWKKKVDADRAK